jgi:hypothetical protein
MRKSAIIGALALVVSGCYTYRPITTPPRVSERVRLSLTRQGTEELARFLGPRVVMAEGALASMRNDGALVVAVDFVQTADGIKQPWSGEGVVAFPTGYIEEMKGRTFLRRQTYVAGTAFTTGLVALAIVALKNGGAGGNGGGGGPPPPP